MFRKKQKNQLYYEQLLLNKLFSKKKIEINDIDAQKIKSLEESNKEILDRYPSRAVVPQIMEKLESKRIKYLIDNFLSAFIRFIPVMAAAALIITIIPKDVNYSQFFLRLKGGEPQIIIYRQSGNEILRLKEKMTVNNGDNLQIAYNSAGWEYGCIFSIDGNSNLTLHYPLEIDQAKMIKSKGLNLLPYSFQLDDAPLYEKFYFVLSHKDFNLKAIVDSIISDNKINDDILMNDSELITKIITLNKGSGNEN